MLKRRPVSTLLAFAVLAASPLVMTTAAHADSNTGATAPTAATAPTTSQTSTSATVSQTDAVQIARNLLDLPESQWSLGSVDMRTGQDTGNRSGHPSYLLNFVWGSGTIPKGYSAEVDATNGQLLNMSYWDKSQTSAGTLSKEEVQAAAAAFLQKVAPDAFKQSVLRPDPNAAYDPQAWTHFIYIRQENGIPVLGDQIRVAVASNGKIVNYSLDWTDATFPSATSTISQDQANQIYKQTLALRLQYEDDYSKGGNSPQEKLVYEPAYRNLNLSGDGYEIVHPLIDAQTGQTLGADGQATTDLNTADSAQPLLTGGPTEPSPLGAELTQAEAEKWAAQTGLIPADAVLVTSEYRPLQNDPIWQLSYEIQDASDGNGKPYLSITLNAKTGEVEDYNYAEPKLGQSSTALSLDQLRAKAIQTVKQFYPNRLGALAGPDDPFYLPGNTNQFNFHLLKNGIPTSQLLTVMLDPANGTLLNMSLNDSVIDSDNLTFPDPKQAIAETQAQTIFMTHQPLELAYFFPTDSSGTRSATPRLVYTPVLMQYDHNRVDALTGTWLDDSSTAKPNPLPTDIKGHWAEKALTLFAERGLLELDNGQAHPDQQMTRAQFVRLLVGYKSVEAVGNVTQTFSDVPPDSKYYQQIEAAVQQKWIATTDKFNPNAPISREEAATILARAQGYADLAHHREIFQLPYSDADTIDDWAYGSVAILDGLSLMTGVDATHFAPHETITLAQAVTLLSKTNP